MKVFQAIDISGNINDFQFTFEYDDFGYNEVEFKVYSLPPDFDSMRWFSYKFIIIDDNTAKADTMSINGCQEFSKMGIPEKIIEIASKELKRTILSSPTIPTCANFLVGPSYKVWERLVSTNNDATLDSGRNCFILHYIA